MFVCVCVCVCVYVCVCVCASGKCAYSDIQTFNQDTNHDKHRNYLSNFNTLEIRYTRNLSQHDACVDTPVAHFRSINLRTNDTPLL